MALSPQALHPDTAHVPDPRELSSLRRAEIVQTRDQKSEVKK